MNESVFTAAATRPPLNEGGLGSAWVLTFCDLMLLILVFFLMLYATNTPRTREVAAAVGSIAQTLNPENIKPRLSLRPPPEPALTATRTAPASNLSYLRLVLEQTRVQSPALKDMLLTEQEGQLVISLPGDLLFPPGETMPRPDAAAAVGELASVLSRLSNRVAVAGHAEPLPLSPSGLSAWELSLARAASVAAMLVAHGYSGHPLILGYGDSRPLPASGSETGISAESGAALARRVDLLVLPGREG